MLVIRFTQVNRVIRGLFSFLRTLAELEVAMNKVRSRASGFIMLALCLISFDFMRKGE